MLTRELVPLAACIAAIALTACTSSTPPTALGRGESRSRGRGHPGSLIYANRSAHVYRGTETFCLHSPLSGTATYSVHAGIPRFALDMRGFPPKTGIGLDWINNAVRGYTVAAFTTDASGRYAGAARMFRFGEVRAVAIRFERANGTGLPGTGKSC